MKRTQKRTGRPSRVTTPKEHDLFFTDNGRILCQVHLGMSAAITGRDISGQPIERVTDEDLKVLVAEFGEREFCETCNAQARAAARRAGGEA